MGSGSRMQAQVCKAPAVKISAHVLLTHVRGKVKTDQKGPVTCPRSISSSAEWEPTLLLRSMSVRTCIEWTPPACVWACAHGVQSPRKLHSAPSHEAQRGKRCLRMSTKPQNEATEWIRAGRQERKKKVPQSANSFIGSGCRQHRVEVAPGLYLRSVARSVLSISDVPHWCR